jgi:hypothetical protein
MTLRDALQSGRWFYRKSWEWNPSTGSFVGTLESFAFRWRNGQLERAFRGALLDTKISERRFGPLDVLANDWERADG